MNGHLLLTLPIAIPLLALVICAALHRHRRAQRLASLAGSVLLLAAAVALLASVFDGTVLATDLGSWPAPFGISLVVDLFSGAMVVITGIMAVAVSVFSLVDGARERERAFYHPLYHGLLLGVTGAFMTGDLFNLYVWFEVMLISSFGLLVVGGSREQLDAGVKYVTLNLVATTLFLMSVGMLYGMTGTLNMADMAQALPGHPNQGLVTTVAVLMLIAFGAKAALFPLFFWLPASYHTASAPVVAIFAALLTKVGVYAIIRVFTLLFSGDAGYSGPIIAVVAALTMVTGVLGAASHYDIRRILSFHIVSQIGYMLIGVAVATPLALAGSILYVLHHIVVKANLFLVAGAVRLAGGSFDLRKIGGLHRSAPLLAALFLVPAMSLAGIPPLSGFWAKFVVIRSSLDAGHVALAAVALVVGVLTLYSMVKIWNEAFWKAPTAISDQAAAEWRKAGPTAFVQERGQLRQSLLLFDLVFSGVCAMIGFSLARQMQRPVTLLTQHLALAEGDLPRPVARELIPAHDPQTARLIQAFNRMAESASQREAMLGRLVDQEREAVLGRMAATLAHEIRNPLGGIATAIGTLRKFGDQPEARQEAVDFIERGVVALQNVTDATLKTHRPADAARRLRIQDLHDVRLLAAADAGRRDVTIELDAALPPQVPVPATEVRQLLLNLLLNAVRATSAGGTVILRARLRKEVLLLEVIDQGCGLAPEVARGMASGVAPPGNPGLGVAVIVRLVERLRGRVSVNARSDGGTHIALRLPLASAPDEGGVAGDVSGSIASTVEGGATGGIAGA